MIPIEKLAILIRGTLEEWWRIPWSDLRLSQGRETTLALVMLIGLSLLVLLARNLRSSKAGWSHVTLPAVLPMMRQSHLSATRHVAFLLFLVGMGFFAVALADPHTAFTREEVSHPGRRIAIILDGSSSMILNFDGDQLRREDGSTFYTAVATAEHFIRLRMKGPYHDLVSLIEFGNDSYVVTPFTTDYENILLSTRLVGTPRNWGRFADWGTTITEGLRQGVELFRTFEFLEASGNLMILISDGRDDQVIRDGRALEDLIAEVSEAQIPIYMIRIAQDIGFGELDEDVIWQAAMEQTGGRFYAADNEEAILRATEEIDGLTAGRIDVREYTVYRPRFAGYALIAVALWTVAAALKLTLPQLQTFP